MKTKYLTDRGQVRKHNEDSGGVFYNPSNQLLAIIADGMGGHRAGDVASQMAVSIIQEKWQESTAFISPEQTEKWLSKTLQEVNKSIYDKALQNDAYSGMGTTIVVIISVNDFVTVAHVGDSRCYISNENGFNQVTEDHSLVNELVRSGQITADDAVYHPRKNIVLKALGTEEEVTPDVQSLSWEYGDKILLCTDGLTDKLSNEELSTFIQLDNIQETGKQLIDVANERGGEDNISLIILYRNHSDEVGEPSC